ncbi:DNA polymerase III, alpha subunit, partial [Vibrio parahaemolyticus VP2007-007]
AQSKVWVKALSMRY